jgi:dTDP-glucose 4,6-dehydratase
MRYCILGGGGSFGLHTAKFLLVQEDTEWVISVGRSPPKHKAFLLGIDNWTPKYGYVLHHVTYNHDALVEMLAEVRPDVIVNFAAQGEGATSFTESWRYFETNCVGLSHLIEELAGEEWLKRFVHIGSSEVYGSTEAPAHEGSPLRPTSPYAISTAAFDQYLLAMIGRGFPATILRPSNCYGEGQQLHRFVPKAFLFGMTGRKMPLHGGGTAEKSYMHSEDLARAIHLVCTQDMPGGVYNAGPESPTSMSHVAAMVANRLDKNFDEMFEVAEDRAHQDLRYWLDSSKIRRFGWEPKIDWWDGMSRVKRWVSDNLDELHKMPTEFMMRP